MPAKSKQQQKFMGLVHAYKKGEVPASKVSKSVKDAAKSMSKKSVKKYAKTKHDDLPKKVTEKKERDYKAEYKKFQSSTKAKKYRAELNKYNRQKGTYGNGDGKDASHKGGKIVGFEAQSKNRGRREKSRLKKESAFSVKIDTFQNAMKSLDKLSDILKKGGEKKKSMMVSKLIKQLQQAFFRKEIMEHNIKEDITKLEVLAMNLLRDINRNAGVKNYDHKKTADFNKVVKFLKGKMPKVPNQRIGQIAMSYDKYRQKQPKIRIPDIDSVKDMEKTLKKLGMKESVNEQQYFDPKGKLKKYMDKVLKQAGIRVITYDPMKQSFYNGVWGGFYTVASSNKVDMPGQGKVKRSSAVLPVYIDKKGEVELGVSGDGFKLGKVNSSQVLKNLKDFKKSDLEESINEKAWTPEQTKAVEKLDKKFYKLIGKKGIQPYSYEAAQMWTKGGFRDEMKKIFGKDVKESVNEMKVYSKSQGIKKIKSMKKTGGAKIYKVDKVKTKIGGKNVSMYNLYTRNQNHTSNQNPYGLDMAKGVYLIPIEEGTCGYGLDGNLGEEPAGPHLMKKIKKITKDKKKKK